MADDLIAMNGLSRCAGAIGSSVLLVAIVVTACTGTIATPAPAATPVPGATTARGTTNAASPSTVAPATDAGPAQSASAQLPSPSASGGAVPQPSLPAAESTTFLAAAQAELDLHQQLRDDVDAQAVLGPNGGAFLADIDEAQKAFGEAALAEFVKQTKLDIATATQPGARLAIFRPLAPPRPDTADEWTGSMFGNTSLMVSMWLGFAPLMIESNAGAAQFQQATQQKTETHDSQTGGQIEHLVLTERVTFGAGQGRVVFDVVITSTAVITDMATGAEVARRISTDNGHFEVNACPDAQGIGEGKYTLVDQEEVSRPGGVSNGGSGSTQATFRVLNGDDAHLIETGVEAAVAAGAHGTHVSADGATGDPFDWGAQATYAVTIPASGSARYGDVTNQASHDATPTNLGALGSLIAIADNYVAEAAKAAEKFWRSGQCIELKPSEQSRTVRPDEQITLTVDSKHKWDGQQVTAGIEAAFSGVASLSPTGEQVSPIASFDFVAGPTQGDKGTIDLTQEGKRGIGKMTVEFTVAGVDYRAEYTGRYLAGTLQYCGAQPHPYWGLSFVDPAAEPDLLAFDFPPGSNGPVRGQLSHSLGFGYTRFAQGTGEFLPGNPPRFRLVLGDGTYTLTLKVGTFCHPAP